MATKAKIFPLERKDDVSNPKLLAQLKEAVIELEENMKVSKSVFKGGRHIGFGADKTQIGIAADAVISIARAIKSEKGW